MDRSDVCDISQHLRGGLNEDVALRLSKSVMESNSLREIVEQITALEAVEQTDEIRIILEELKVTTTSICCLRLLPFLVRLSGLPISTSGDSKCN